MGGGAVPRGQCFSSIKKQRLLRSVFLENASDRRSCQRSALHRGFSWHYLLASVAEARKVKLVSAFPSAGSHQRLCETEISGT